MNFDKKDLGTDIGALFGCGCGGDRCNLKDGAQKYDCRGNEFPENRKSSCLDGYPLAMVYAVSQEFKGINEPETALARGTIFKELDLPFTVIDGGKKC